MLFGAKRSLNFSTAETSECISLAIFAARSVGKFAGAPAVPAALVDRDPDPVAWTLPEQTLTVLVTVAPIDSRAEDSPYGHGAAEATAEMATTEMALKSMMIDVELLWSEIDLIKAIDCNETEMQMQMQKEIRKSLSCLLFELICDEEAKEML